MNPPTHDEQKRKFWGKMIWISAISLVFTVILAISLPILGMVNAFSSLKTSGAADPSEAASEISRGMIVGMYALPFAFISLVFFIIAVIRHRKFSNPVQAG